MSKMPNHYQLEKLPVKVFPFTDLIDAIQKNSQTYRDKKIFHFAEDGRNFDQSLTYGELYDEGLRIAAYLSKHVGHGERALLLYSSGLDFVKCTVGCILSGVIAVPAPPPRNARSIEKLKKVFSDCSPKIIFYGNDTKKFLQAQNISLQTEFGCPSITATEASQSGQTSLKEFTPHKNDIVLLQYTSGSTGNPKGVIITHGNLLANCGMFGSSMNFSEKTIKVSWLPVYHDMGFVGSIASGLVISPTIYIIDPFTFAADPLSWLAAITKKKATLSGGPNFAFELAVKKFKRKPDTNLDFQHLEMMYCGSEPIQWSTLSEFFNTFEKFGLKPGTVGPCYGLAEATLIVSGSKVGEAPKQEPPHASAKDPITKKYVSVGHIFNNEEVLITDPKDHSKILNEGEVGEIIVCGSHISTGYWKNSRESDQSFDLINRRKYLKTGDLGFIKGNSLYITGRQKDLIIVNGRNIYPSDVEAPLSTLPEFRTNGIVAASIEDGKGEHLMVIAELNPDALKANHDALLEKVSRNIYDHAELTTKYIFFVKPGGISRTTSGKLMRAETKRLLLSSQDLLVFGSVNIQSITQSESA